NVGLTVNDGATAATDFESLVTTLTANDADADLFGLVISSAATANAAAGSYEALITLTNAENTAGAVTDALLITTTSATAGDITDAIDASAADITNALNVGANTITGTSYSIDASGTLHSARLASTLLPSLPTALVRPKWRSRLAPLTPRKFLTAPLPQPMWVTMCSTSPNSRTH
ncbi:MAG: hypothetical protein AAB538_02405, partial [Patescibacteria group bacterium]